MTHPMLEALHAPRAQPALAAKLNPYGQFVGSWDLDIEYRDPAGATRRAAGEWHFNWVLDGKAIQDVWIFPARHLRGGGTESWHMYGSTFRWYDPAIDGWHITWLDPSRPMELRQIGRAVGSDIVQLGDELDGVQRRWRFVDIAERSFRWIGDATRDRGASWTLEMEMRARRTARVDQPDAVVSG